MLRNFKGLIICLTLTITGSGCASTEVFVEPLCLPTRPTMVPLSIEDQRWLKEANQSMFTDIAVNDFQLKLYIALVERLVAAHNEQFEAECW